MPDVLIQDVPFPGMPDLPELWAVHIEAADEIVPFLDEAAAEKLVACLDGMDEEERKKAQAFSVFFNAKLIPWPGSRAEFAEALRMESADRQDGGQR